MSHIEEKIRAAVLDERTIDRNPFRQFSTWFADAERAMLSLHNAAMLATSTIDGKPSGRLVLLKEVNDHGFTFFTNYTSRKSRELAENPFACLVFHWITLERQVRIEGRVEKVPREESEKYFQTRPRESQIGALASPQSSAISSRGEIEKRFQEIKEQYEGKIIECPDHWGGFCLVPESIEFWQGRESRLHDRIVFTRTAGHTWKIERLAP